MDTKVYKESELTSKDYEQLGALLRGGEVIAFPTETVYGLGAVYCDPAAVRKIFEAKGRDEGKPLSVLIGEISQMEMLALDIPKEAYKLAERFWPGPLTLIVKKNDSVPAEVTAGGDTIGIRMPACRAALELIKAAGAPLAAPSANTSGKRSSCTALDVLKDLNGKIDALVDGGECSIGISSTIYDLESGKILRQGSITPEQIQEALK